MEELMDKLKQKRRLTPLMGWASWNCFRTNISEELLKKQVDLLISTGLASHGYTYFNVDDGFFGGRTESSRLKFHEKRFPNGIRVIKMDGLQMHMNFKKNCTYDR